MKPGYIRLLWWRLLDWWEMFRFPCSACGKPLGFRKWQSGAYDPDIIHVKCLERYAQQEGLTGQPEGWELM